MSLEQFVEKLRELKISEIEGIISSQGSQMESPVLETQLKDSGVKEEQPKPETISIKKEHEEITLPIEGIIPVSSWQMGSSIQVEELEVNKAPLMEKPFLQKSLLQCLQESSSLEEWQSYLNNNTTEKDTSPDYWHKTKVLTRWENATPETKLGLKTQPLKHKNLLQKPKLLCIQGNPKAKSLDWIKGIHKIKEESSNPLRKSKLFCHQGKSREWIKSNINIQEENTNWVWTTDISLGFKALAIECKNFPNSQTAYDMKALTDECVNLEHEKQVARDALMNDFKALIKECENMEAPREDYGSRYQNPNEVNADELAGYLNNTLHIPKEMSVMAESMYT